MVENVCRHAAAFSTAMKPPLRDLLAVPFVMLVTSAWSADWTRSLKVSKVVLAAVRDFTEHQWRRGLAALMWINTCGVLQCNRQCNREAFNRRSKCQTFSASAISSPN